MTTADRDNVLAIRMAELGNWLAGSGSQAAETVHRSAIERLVRGRDQRSFLSMQISVSVIPTFPLARGICDVIAGQSDRGWSDIHSSVQLSYWWWRGILARAQKEKLQLGGDDIGLDYYTFSHACLLALAISDAQTADWFARQALKMVVDGTARASGLEMEFPEFVGSVCAAWLGSPAPSSTEMPEVLSAPLANRDDDARLADSMPALLDYHLLRCDTNSEANPDSSYRSSGLALLPTIALAVVALRGKAARGSLPAIDHPLTALPTWTPPSNPVPRDALIPLLAERVLRLESGKY